MTHNLLGRIASTLICAASFFTASSQTGELPRSTPEAEGIPSKAVYTLFDSLTSLPRTEIHSVMVLRHGKVVGEIYPAPIKAEYMHTLYSASKTFVGAAVGLAVADNRLRLTDRVALFFPESLPENVSSNLAAMTVRDLLTMTSGIDPDWNMRNITPDWIKTYLSKPANKPGIDFKYDSMCTYLLSAIVQKATGMKVLDYLKLKIFNDMHITDIEWQESPEGYNTGGWGLHIQPESLAKFGLLLINKGNWNGKQLIPAEWVTAMTSSQQKTYACDYCYQTWRAEYPGSFRADGALGQYILMVPDKDIVVVITECTMIDGIRQRNLVWNILMPSITDKHLTAGKDLKTLRKKETAYTLATPKGNNGSGISRYVYGKNIKLDNNRLNWASLNIQQKGKQLSAKITLTDGKSFTLPCGYNRWVTTTTDAEPPYSISPVGKFTGIKPHFYVAGSYAWKAKNTLNLKIQYANWVSAVDAAITFNGNDVTINAQENYSSEPFIIKGKVSE